MYTKIIIADDDYELTNSPTKREMATVTIENNPDAATIILGYKGRDGAFHAYEDGLLTTVDTRVNCGEGTRLMARVGGVSTTLTINTSSYGV